MKSSEWTPKFVLTPSILAIMVFVYGFIAWTGLISFTNSTLLPRFEFVGLRQYAELWQNERWFTAFGNLGIFATLFILGTLVIGVTLAVLLDQKIRGEGFLRTVYLYPLAVSFIVTGTAWKWLLNPSTGLFEFDWLVRPDRAVYTLVIAAIWQTSGFVMALFLAGLRGLDPNLLAAARIDGAGWGRVYLRIVLPALRPVFFSAIVCVAHIAIKSFDLVVALTGGGPGYSSDLPSTFMYTHAFQRGQMAFGSASAFMMLATVLALVVPYIYSELKAGTKR